MKGNTKRMRGSRMKRVSLDLIRKIKLVQVNYYKSTGKRISFVKASRLFSNEPTRFVIVKKKRTKKGKREGGFYFDIMSRL